MWCGVLCIEKVDTPRPLFNGQLYERSLPTVCWCCIPEYRMVLHNLIEWGFSFGKAIRCGFLEEETVAQWGTLRPSQS